MNLALNLNAQRRCSEAQPLFQKALDIRRRVLGDEHPDSTLGYNNLALNLDAQGKYTEAEACLERAIHSYESSRIAGAFGLDRASLTTFNPRLHLAVLRKDRDPTDAWNLIEHSLARGLLDQQHFGSDSLLTAAEKAEEIQQRERIASLLPRIMFLAAKANRSETETTNLESLLKQRRDAETRLAVVAVTASKRAVAGAETIRQALPPDAALLFWVDLASSCGTQQEHWCCVVRLDGTPKWERLPSTGPDGKWSESDDGLPERVRTALSKSATQAEVELLVKQLHAQRIAPALKHLEGTNKLFVIPVNYMAGIPVELLAPNRVVSYVPSGTFLARSRNQAPPTAQRLLALGDPIFTRTDAQAIPSKKLPGSGLLITHVIPESAAAKARLQVGDVILKYGDFEVKDLDGLKTAISANEKAATVPITLWRENADKPIIRDIASGTLGVVLDKDPAPVAVANRQKTNLLLLSQGRGDWKDLPGTRVEINQLRQLFGEFCEVLTDSAASEQTLEKLRKSGELSKYRYLHFATHGEGNAVLAFESALILAQDKLPSEVISRAGEPTIDGRLSAREVAIFWKLNAELVTLSACETAEGKSGAGEGLLGFAQAFLNAGSRSVCLSLWKVDDTATALLMDRFYKNLLGKRAGLTKPMGKAAALDEAKRWLRDLSAEQALALTAKLTNGVSRDGRAAGVTLNVAPSPEPKAPLPGGAKPFANPRYWAAFILIGDPN